MTIGDITIARIDTHKNVANEKKEEEKNLIESKQK